MLCSKKSSKKKNKHSPSYNVQINPCSDLVNDKNPNFPNAKQQGNFLSPCSRIENKHAKRVISTLNYISPITKQSAFCAVTAKDLLSLKKLQMEREPHKEPIENNHTELESQQLKHKKSSRSCEIF